jgi:hypothetical protein
MQYKRRDVSVSEEKKPIEATTANPEKPVCSFCGNTSHDKVLLHGIYQEKPVFVCTACMPRLIHG